MWPYSAFVILWMLIDLFLFIQEFPFISASLRFAVVAIDFGNCYSGYAFSLNCDWSKIHHQHWNSSEYISNKAPTSVLFNADKSFCAFGYDAESIYSGLDESNLDDMRKKQEYYYFQRLKDILSIKNLNLDTDIEDITKKKMKALDIVSMLIKYLKTSVLRYMNQSREDIFISDFDFVLAVPATNGEGAKLFIREAAQKAGIEANQLTIIYKEEAVFSYFHYLHMSSDHLSHDYFYDLQRAEKFMIVDLGESSVDLAVLTPAEDGTLEKMFPHTMEEWGGIYIFYEFERFLGNIVGEDILKSFAKDCLDDYLDTLNVFQGKMRSSQGFGNVFIPIPLSFQNLVEKKYHGGLEEALKSSIYKDSVTYKQRRLRMPIKEFEKLFHKTIQKLFNFIGQYLDDEVKILIIVGRLAECQFIRDSIQNRFKTTKNVIPDEPENTVLKGAVFYGHKPNTKSSLTQCIAFK